MARLYFGFVCLALLALIQNGESLRCWSCSSDMEFSCMDYFNTTRVLQQQSYSNYNNQYQRQSGPNLVECSNNLGQLYNTRQVCMKKVITPPNGRQIVMRECKSVSGQQRAGRCPNEPTGRGTTIDFCEYCEYDGCNSANGLSTTVLALLIPSVFLLFLYK